ncbi:MAG: radical SAM protein [Candidatus Riflebacteria bacterium]|nr:radical SAM protein [Candidatus Riflebacteria bacterium]
MSNNPYSNLKIFWHNEKLKAISNKEITAPVYVRVKPTNKCNHHCFYCSYNDKDLRLREGVRFEDEIPWPILQKTIDDFHSIGVKAITFSGGGEPLVYPHIEQAAQMILEKNIDLSLITNGQLLRGSVADLFCRAKWVRISMDAATAETFSKIRNISSNCFFELIKNIEHFAATKNSDCEFGVNFVVNHENVHQTYEMAKLIKSLGANHIKYTARITKDLFDYHKDFKEEAIFQIRRAVDDLADEKFKVINKYEDDFNLSMVFERSYSFCPINQIVTVIGADSKIYPCHDKAYVLGAEIGDLHQMSFKDIWFSEDTKKLFESFNSMVQCRHHCVYDDRNILINEILKSHGQHVNFI